MQTVKFSTPQLIENLELQNNENADPSFGNQITPAKRFPSQSADRAQSQHQSLYNSKNKVFAEIGNRSLLESNPAKLPTKPTKLNQLQVGQQYLRKAAQENTETTKEGLKIVINRAEQGQRKNLKLLKISQTSHKQEVSNVSDPHPMEESIIKLDTNQRNHLFGKAVIPSIFQQCSHVMKPIKRNYEIQHVFNRHNSCAFSEPVTFNLPTKAAEFLQSQKMSRLMCSEFKMFLNKKGQKYELGRLKSNFVGSIYNFYPNGSDVIYYSILFKNKDDKSFSNLKYCEIFINKSLIDVEGHHQNVPYEQMKSLQGLYLVNKDGQNKDHKNEIIKLQSEIPIWSLTHDCFCLKFPKKVLPSAKNTVLVDEDGKEVLKFFKNSQLTYNVTFENPLSWVVAYGLALAMTDFKLFTE